MIKIATWNVNGARARETQIVELIANESPDVLCLQETKATVEQLPASLYGLMALPEYHAYWHGAAGYSGVAILLKKAAFSNLKFSHPSFDMETRVVIATAQIGNFGEVAFASMYAPNGGKDYKSKIEFFEALVQFADDYAQAGKEIVICGDINIALTETDVHKSQRRNDTIGQRPEERALFRAILEKGRLVDVGRKLAPDDAQMFSWWPYWRSAREKNVGWRLDYVLASERIAAKATQGRVQREFGASDHAPVVIDFEI